MKPQIPWLRVFVEGVVIVGSILLALAADAWWDGRQDSRLEEHLLQGIGADLVRDTLDIAAAMNAAMGRAAGADELLSLIGDPLAGTIQPPPPGGTTPANGVLGDWLVEARRRYPPSSIRPGQALHMVTATSSIQTVGLSNATFSEATASGTLDVITDDDLRTLITNYYFRAGQFSPADDRAERHWDRLRSALAEEGVAIVGDALDDEVLSVLTRSGPLLAELKNARDMAVFQLTAHAAVLNAAVEVLNKVQSSVSR